MVVAVKREDRIVVGVTGCDSLVDMTVKDLSLEENVPFWKVTGTKDCYVFADILSFEADLLRYNPSIFKEITDGKSVFETALPKMKALLGKYNRISEKGEWSNKLLIVKGDKMFSVDAYFTVSEEDGFVGLDYEQYLLGALEESRDLSQEESVLFAVRNLKKMINRELFPLVLFDSKTKKKKVLYQ